MCIRDSGYPVVNIYYQYRILVRGPWHRKIAFCSVFLLPAGVCFEKTPLYCYNTATILITRSYTAAIPIRPDTMHTAALRIRPDIVNIYVCQCRCTHRKYFSPRRERLIMLRCCFCLDILKPYFLSNISSSSTHYCLSWFILEIHTYRYMRGRRLRQSKTEQSRISNGWQIKC